MNLSIVTRYFYFVTFTLKHWPTNIERVVNSIYSSTKTEYRRKRYLQPKPEDIGNDAEVRPPANCSKQ